MAKYSTSVKPATAMWTTWGISVHTAGSEAWVKETISIAKGLSALHATGNSWGEITSQYARQATDHNASWVAERWGCSKCAFQPPAR